MKRKSRTLNLKTPLRIYLLAGASSVVLVALAVLLVTRTVQADAGIRPASSAPSVSLAASATPATLATSKAIHGKQIGIRPRLHGLASWYGGIFDGRTTASGERFDMNAMTACHPTLPFGTIVRVIDRVNHRSVVVRINDRGDLVDQKRIIDLSYGAAQRLAMVDSGLAPVDVQVIRLGRGEK